PGSSHTPSPLSVPAFLPSCFPERGFGGSRALESLATSCQHATCKKLTVPEGDFVALVGPSGSGKTTLLNLIGCLDTPDAGVVRLEGQETGGLGERELTKIRSLKIDFVFQQFLLLPTLTVLENVQLPAIFLRHNDREKHAAELLDRVHLGARAHHHPKQLSGGEMQRVAIAPGADQRPEDPARRRADLRPGLSQCRDDHADLPRPQPRRPHDRPGDLQHRAGPTRRTRDSPFRRSRRRGGVESRTQLKICGAVDGGPSARCPRQRRGEVLPMRSLPGGLCPPEHPGLRR
ncbi:MAG: ATP-binding cassette domain-containing protein, partial [Acidobacteria bacterium]|nr:ATP-binding cassette domain-containing protein [Acidobacteriota bacterium]